MNPRVIPVVVLLAAIAVCAYFFLWSGPTPSAAPSDGAADSERTKTSGAAQSAGGTGKNVTSGNSSNAAVKKPAVNWKGLADPTNYGGKLHPQAADIEHFLAKHGETAVNLVVAFERTGDHRWLDRALEQFPRSPIVLKAAVESTHPAPKAGETYQPDAQRMALIERFKAADPNNPLPWIYSAGDLFRAGQTGDAVGEIRAALQRPAFYTYANEYMDSRQHLYETLGLSSVEAGFVSSVNLGCDLSLAALLKVSGGLIEWQKSAADSGDTTAAADAIQLSYKLARTFATSEASRSLMIQLFGLAIETSALEALPADAHPDYMTVTPAQRLAEIKTQRQDWESITGSYDRQYGWLLQSQNAQLLAEYVRRSRSDGQLSALIWLRTQKK